MKQTEIRQGAAGPTDDRPADAHRLRRTDGVRARRDVRTRQSAASGAADADDGPDHRHLGRPRRRRQGPCRRRVRRAPRPLVLPVPFHRRPGDAGLPRRSTRSGSSPASTSAGAACRAAAARSASARSSSPAWSRPTVKLIEYTVDFTRVIDRKLKLGIANGTMRADGEVIYTTYRHEGRAFPGIAGGPPMRRVVITGLGIVSSIGNDAEEVDEIAQGGPLGHQLRARIRRARLPQPGARAARRSMSPSISTSATALHGRRRGLCLPRDAAGDRRRGPRGETTSRTSAPA